MKPDLALVFTTNSSAEAEILKSLLESEGIRCELEGTTQGGLTGVLDIRGFTAAADEQAARKALDQHAHARDPVPHRAPEHVGDLHPQVAVAHGTSSRQYHREKS